MLVGYFLIGTWAYKKNKADHEALGEKVDKTGEKLEEMMNQLGEKIDAVRQAITDHETIWHSPSPTVKRAKKAAKKK